MNAAKPARHQSTGDRLDDVLEAALSGADITKLLAGLSHHERKLFQELVTELRSGKSEIVDQLWKVDYVRRPPTMEEFITDPYWLGGVTMPSADSQGLFPFWRQTLIRDFDLDSRIHNVVITGSYGAGKCLGKDTPIRMADGSVKMSQDVRNSDQVMGDDGTPRNVTGVVVGHEQMYRVTMKRPKNGLVWSCNDSHILVLRKPTGETIEASAGDVYRNPKKYRGMCMFRRGYELPGQPVHVDPYWLGLWIGDGNSHDTSLTISDDDPEILAYHRLFAAKHGLDVNVRVDKRGNKSKVYTLFAGRWAHHPVLEQMRKYDFCTMTSGSGTRKWIPEAYLRNSTRVRRQLLAGLIDSDGCRCKNGLYEIAFASQSLAESTLDLVRSLGYSGSYSSRMVKNKKFKKPAMAYRVTFGGAYDVPVRVERKKSTPPVSSRTGGNRRLNNVTGFTLTPIADTTYYGFELDGNRRFLLADGTVTHNTYIMCIILLYRMALAVLLRNPQAFFGLGKGSRILYVLLSLTKSVVTETSFGDTQNFMANSPFFLEECKFNPDKKYSDFSVPLGKGIYLTAGSKGWHIIGRNTMGVALDEGNWRLEANPDQRAYKLYDEVRTRIKNRFQKVAGFLPAVSILASSARDESSFTERVIDDIKKVDDPKTEIIYRIASFEVKRGIVKLDPLWFKVAHGLKTAEPRILMGLYDEHGKEMEGPFETTPPGMTVTMVPKDFLDAFKRNVTSGLQNICGVSIGGGNRLFSSVIDVEKAVTQGEATGLKCPTDLELIPLSAEDDRELWDYVRPERFAARRGGAVQPQRDPEALRFAHIDLATRNVAGLAICHVVGRQLVTGIYDKIKGEAFNEYRLLVEYDFILAITAGKTKPINIEKIQNFLLWLRNKCGYRFGGVTADTYQSVSPLQMLESRGFKTAVLSLDRSKGPYYSWRTAFEESRVRMYRHNLLMREVEQLLDTPDKIDHPDAEKGGCFVGGTRVKLLDGTIQTLAELTTGGKASFWVYSSLPDGRIVPGLAHSARVTKQARELVRVTLDSGETELCTPDHRWMLRDGSYARAKDLLPGTSLMPLHYSRARIKYKRGSAEYEQLKVNGVRQFTHRLVAGHFATIHGLVVHHYDFDPLNNTPANLVPMTTADHNALHARLAERLRDPAVIAKRVATFKSRHGAGLDPEVTAARSKKARDGMLAHAASMSQDAKHEHSSKTRAGMRAAQVSKGFVPKPGYVPRAPGDKLKSNAERDARISSFAKSDRGRELSRTQAARLNSAPLSAERKAVNGANAMKAQQEYNARLDAERLAQVLERGIRTVKDAMQQLGGGRATWKRRFAEWQLNHKVVSVVAVECDDTPVYDITVETYHNFALASGVFVHNSKDVADACAGAHFGAINHSAKVASDPSASEPALYGNNDEAAAAAAAPVTLVPAQPPARVATWSV